MSKRRWKLAFGIVATSLAAQWFDSMSYKWGLFGWQYWLMTMGYALGTAGMIWLIIEFVRGEEPAPKQEESSQGDMYGR